ncbi:MAG TPA: hypothetical protein VIM65_10060 [Cyclobacteriaceae bacterium]
MEFEELQQIWDSQNNQSLYAINEQALYNRILSKKKQVNHITNTSELLIFIVNIVGGCFILGTTIYNQKVNISMYILSAWMFSSASYLLLNRVRRIKEGHQFERSMLGELKHALSTATYQVRLSQAMRWNIVPVGLLSILSVIEDGKSTWIIIILLIFFMLAFFAGGWEHGIYRNKKHELEILLTKLQHESSDDNH